MYNGCTYVLQAEARLAAKRAARAEARSIRLKELERQQQEGEDVCSRWRVLLLSLHYLMQTDTVNFVALEPLFTKVQLVNPRELLQKLPLFTPIFFSPQLYLTPTEISYHPPPPSCRKIVKRFCCMCILYWAL